MSKKQLALIGGDMRELILANALLEAGYNLLVCGLPAELLSRPDCCAPSVAAAVNGADGVILPVAGIGEGMIATPLIGGMLAVTSADFAGANRGGTLFCGVGTKMLSNVAEVNGLTVTPVMDRDDIAIANAIPTAEGALELAMRETDQTIFGSIVVICGYGRVGKAVARLFERVGAQVTVFSRNAVEHHQGRADHFDMRRYVAFPCILPRADIVINTVPALVLDSNALELIGPDALIIDLASRPGGVDRAAAEARGLNALHALGLPGRCAGRTAGHILADGYLTLLPEYGYEPTGGGR